MNKLKEKMKNAEEIFYFNKNLEIVPSNLPYSKKDIEEAEARLARFAPYIMAAFPETKVSNGIIESPLTDIPKMASALGVTGRLMLKEDAKLPISGSVKARGGIYEVLKLAEKIAIKNNILSLDDDYSIIATDQFKALFSNYSVAVGSTGNLGLSIGIISAKLGFKVTVHMSSDARQWKKDMLRAKGAKVVEYQDDYQKAVAEGRKEAARDPMCHFVDDENSSDLFLGYSVAGKRLKKYFDEKNLIVDEDHPLNVYIPCGVGGAPGGIAFGIKEYFGKHSHIYFVEPTMAPCMTLGLVTGLHEKIAISDIGLDGKTIADGLAVGRPSALVSQVSEKILDGCFTVKDERLLPLLKDLYDIENIFIEPSACAVFPCVKPISDKYPDHGYHIVWATGGNMVPDDERAKYLKGQA
ncbi:MAG: D-serine ammonia-lyase [Anaerovoracaceae bacterium]